MGERRLSADPSKRYYSPERREKLEWEPPGVFLTCRGR